MEQSAFDLLRKLERSWWYRARARALSRALARAKTPPTRILDFGSGWGGMHDVFSKNRAKVYAFEPNDRARAECERRGYTKVFATEGEALALSYDCIALLDVLEHIEEDEAFLLRAKNSLVQDGMLLISVPAFQFLWSSHDIEHQHFRRYTKGELTRKCTEAGYRIRYASYWNTTLFLPAALMRLLGRTGESAFNMSSWLDSLFFSLLSIEAFLMRFMSLPFGISVVMLAEKK